MNPNTISVITPAHITKAYSYTEYQALIESLLKQGKTTGDNHSASMLEYTKLNVQRMRRWDKTFVLNENLAGKLSVIEEKWIWLVLTEAWCGDAAQILPVINKMVQSSSGISLKLLLRDENPDVMDQYLTHGTRSIPKLICLKNDTLEEVGTWGPRPEPAQHMITDYKNHPELYPNGVKELLHSWYAKDKAQHLQQEFEEVILKWANR